MKDFLLVGYQMRIRVFVLCLIFIVSTSIGGRPRMVNIETVSISTAEELKLFAEQVNGGNSFKGKKVELLDNIWLNDTIGWRYWGRSTSNLKTWTPIGNEEHPFEGIFDGNGHFVAGLFTKAGSESFYQGLFGCLRNAIIKNTHIRYSHIIASNFVGSIAGYINLNTSIIGCSNAGSIESDRNYTGGIVGFAEGQNRLVNCYNQGKIYGHRCVGGIIGFYEGGSIYNVYNRGEVIGKYEHVGGIVGEYSEPYHKSVKGTGLHSVPNDTLANCYNTGIICGRDVVGGIAGHINLYPNEVTTIKALIANNYNAGKLVTYYPIVTDGLVGVYAYFSSKEKLLIPSVNRIERDGGACYWSAESCKIVSMEKPRFESDAIRSDMWNNVCYGITKIPRSFRYFSQNEMQKQTFVDLLNEWAIKNSLFSSWVLDTQNKNQGFPVFK